MKNKYLINTGFILGTLLCGDALADDRYKLAVIGDSPGANSIRAGKYEKGIKAIQVATKSSTAVIEAAKQINLCAAYTNRLDWQNSLISCNNAVMLAQTLPSTFKYNDNLLAASLSNRAIMKIKQKQYRAALNDFITALAYKGNEFVEENLVLLMQKEGQALRYVKLLQSATEQQILQSNSIGESDV